MGNNWNFQPIMKDPQLEAQLKQNGYLVIPTFLTTEAVNDLSEYNSSNQPEFIHNAIINSVWHSSDEVFSVMLKSC
jgi:hypothetical protein